MDCLSPPDSAVIGVCGIDILDDADLPEQGPCFVAHVTFVQQTDESEISGRLARQEQVAGNREPGHERGVLVDRLDARPIASRVLFIVTA